MKRLLLIFMLLLSLFLSGCTKNKQDETLNDDNNNTTENEKNEGEEEMKNPIIIITLEDERKITLELYPDVAPITVENFLKLVDQKYFDGVCFHRVIKNFMIQTGGYYIEDNTFNEKEEVPSIKGEFASNGFENNLSHTLGVISMARSNDKNSASSQFFICSAASPHLDGEYAAFGKTIDEASEKIVLEISEVPTKNIGYGFTDFPVMPIVIKSIRRG